MRYCEKDYIRDGFVRTFPSVCSQIDNISFILSEILTFHRKSFNISLMIDDIIFITVRFLRHKIREIEKELNR